ncbi:hypothetical protein G5I_00692 [Acromyrmex echinatior]|uniref:Uncharacterized protein n=1 Tax=Acromyrmex echinatior TaxID=103372 RepID=F4W5J5_ACREC|nr:hypothetical protein G5I_00692 [Acromyrmex echinatior]
MDLMILTSNMLAPFRSLSLKESRLRRSGEIPAILGIEAGAISTSKSISEEWNGENGDDGRNGNGKRRLPREVLTTYKTNMNSTARDNGMSAWLTKAHHSNQNRRRCHDGNRYLKIEKHDTISHFELKRAGGGWEKRQGGEERRGELAQRAEESKEDGFHSGSSCRHFLCTGVRVLDTALKLPILQQNHYLRVETGRINLQY